MRVTVTGAILGGLLVTAIGTRAAIRDLAAPFHELDRRFTASRPAAPIPEPEPDLDLFALDFFPVEETVVTEDIPIPAAPAPPTETVVKTPRLIFECEKLDFLVCPRTGDIAGISAESGLVAIDAEADALRKRFEESEPYTCPAPQLSALQRAQFAVWETWIQNSIDSMPAAHRRDPDWIGHVEAFYREVAKTALGPGQSLKRDSTLSGPRWLVSIDVTHGAPADSKLLVFQGEGGAWNYRRTR